MKAYIYKITNLLNAKVYIGSSVNIKKRKQSHFRDLRKKKHYNPHLQNSFNKHGIDNFEFEIIEECCDKTRWKREAHYIKEYNSLLKGYNIQDIDENGVINYYEMTKAENIKNGKKYYVYDTQGLINNFDCLTDACNFISCNKKIGLLTINAINKFLENKKTVIRSIKSKHFISTQKLDIKKYINAAKTGFKRLPEGVQVGVYFLYAMNGESLYKNLTSEEVMNITGANKKKIQKCISTLSAYLKGRTAHRDLCKSYKDWVITNKNLTPKEVHRFMIYSFDKIY